MVRLTSGLARAFRSSRWLGPLLIALVVGAGEPASVGILAPHPRQFFILSESGKRHAKLDGALALMGFEVREGAAAAYAAARADSNPVLVVPRGESERLSKAQLADVLADVRAGRFVVLEGASPLAVALGVGAAGVTAPLRGYRWRRDGNLPINLPRPTVCPRLVAPPGSTVLADDPRSGAPLVIAGVAGKGRYLIHALPIEPARFALYQYQPFFLAGITEVGEVMPTLAGTDFGVYVDYGYHEREAADALAARLQGWGIRQVSLSAWYEGANYEAFVEHFLVAAHRLGVQVEAWLELPMVSKAFWDQHPQWRQRTAAGQEGHVDWRFLMALEDADCLEAVEAYVTNVIVKHDWDGVNLAEVYFESPGEGFARADLFTPMSDAAKRQFTARFGVDPGELFDPRSSHFWRKDKRLREAMVRYRVELVTKLHNELLAACSRCQAQRPDLHLTVTQIDTLLIPTMREQIGVDIPQLLALRARFPFDLQIEDPFTLWNLGPKRFRLIGAIYRRVLGEGTPFALDINVVDREPDTDAQVLVTKRQRGLELYELIRAIAERADTVYFYAANTLEPSDMRLAPYVAASALLTVLPDGQARYTAERQLSWMVDSHGWEAYLDEQPWPCLADDHVLLPAGTHVVCLRPAPPTAAPALHVEQISGTVLHARQDGGACSFAYRSAGRCYVAFNRAPGALRCDGQPARLPSVGSMVVLPAGTHEVEAIP